MTGGKWLDASASGHRSAEQPRNHPPGFSDPIFLCALRAFVVRDSGVIFGIAAATKLLFEGQRCSLQEPILAIPPLVHDRQLPAWPQLDFVVDDLLLDAHAYALV